MRARKRFGQNFLQDPQLIAKIISAINIQMGDNIIEIGPGRGALTSHLVAAKCHLIVIEIDRDLAHDLALLYPGLNVIEQDILKQDIADLGSNLRVIGNLPYNISTPILFKLLDHLPQIQDMHFMLQLEVVERIIAEPNSKAYGRLSVMAQYYCDAERLLTVPPEAFIPRPKVNSAIVKLTPKVQRAVARDELLFASLVNQAFSMRRKTLRNALKGFVSGGEAFDELEIDPSRRPETLSLHEFIALANHAAGKEP
jgi:16S rRNA (adenine1518-N6/adenine1519-N6)-dimethyltransferase